MALMKKMRNLRSKSRTGSSRPRGGSSMISGSSGSRVSAKSGNPSVTRLIQSTWAARMGKGQPASMPNTMTAISVKLFASKYSATLRMLS